MNEGVTSRAVVLQGMAFFCFLTVVRNKFGAVVIPQRSVTTSCTLEPAERAIVTHHVQRTQCQIVVLAR